jgi:hypothetical protein
MGFNRNGARTFLDVIAKACQLSRLPGFQGGVRRILGNSEAETLFAVWEPFCAVVDILIATDNWYNKRDHSDEAPDGDGEDGTSG